MSGPDSKQSDVSGTLHLCRGFASPTYRLGATAYPGQGKDYPMRNFLRWRT